MTMCVHLLVFGEWCSGLASLLRPRPSPASDPRIFGIASAHPIGIATYHLYFISPILTLTLIFLHHVHQHHNPNPYA